MGRLIRILEDDKDIREICKFLLFEEGYDVQESESVATFSSDNTVPSLFLLDIQLPDGNGLDVCDQLKNNARYSGIPIIIMSANMKGNTKIRSCSADEFIEKPFDINHLLERIDKLAVRWP